MFDESLAMTKSILIASLSLCLPSMLPVAALQMLVVALLQVEALHWRLNPL